MADRVYPSARSNLHPPQPLNPSAANGNSNVGPPPAKSQLHGANRHAYARHPSAAASARTPAKHRRKSRRGCFCSVVCWVLLILASLIVLAAVAGGIFYAVYRPRRPSFSVSSLRVSAFNISSSSSSPLLTSRIDVAVAARNPNRHLTFIYGPTSIAVTSSSGADLGSGSFPAFVHGPGNTTILRATVAASALPLDSAAAASLKKSSTVPLLIRLETRAGVKVGAIKTKRLSITVTCSGTAVDLPKPNKTSSAAAAGEAHCKAKIRVKIWKWTV